MDIRRWIAVWSTVVALGCPLLHTGECCCVDADDADHAACCKHSGPNHGTPNEPTHGDCPPVHHDSDCACSAAVLADIVRVAEGNESTMRNDLENGICRNIDALAVSRLTTRFSVRHGPGLYSQANSADVCALLCVWLR